MQEMCQTKKKRKKYSQLIQEGKADVWITSMKSLTTLDNPHAKQ